VFPGATGGWLRPLMLTVMPRTRSLAVYLLAAVLSVGALVCGLVVAHQREAKLYWQGRPVEYWFNQLGFREVMRSPSGAVRTWGSWNETPEASAKAVRGIGTNAIGFYLRKLGRHVSTCEGQIALAERRVGFEDSLFRIRGVDSERGRAVAALILLKPLPPEVVSELVILSTNGNRDIAGAAQRVLTVKESELGYPHPLGSKSRSVDADLYKIPRASLDLQ